MRFWQHCFTDYRVYNVSFVLFFVQGGGGGVQQNEIPNNMESYMPDYGLFEASRIACPVLPQYHPKQLMELLNSGKIRWVKAILAHLVR